ncbi:MAG: putative 4-hydroxybenzoate polyprenyltransferase [Rikenellaceae bacterium]|nr:putative 4-hydroxybenzoate polyprenyltransferase [Rikenellaceae bacterium]
MLSTVSKYLSLVKFGHTVFALPFAMAGYVYALLSTGAEFQWILLIQILLCMVFARNTAMGFNRWADRKIAADNPRTAGREIPAGKIAPKAAVLFTAANAVGFLVVAATINKLTLLLAPVALFIITGYSFTKRFTAWSHIVLGTALAIAPVGAYIAVTGTVAVVPMILASIVLTWVGGFDILYSLQDAHFDREHGLHSVPARFNPTGAVWISLILHMITAYAVYILGRYVNAGWIYWTGGAVFIALLILQHFVFRPTKTSRIAASFGIINGISSIIFAASAIADMIVLDWSEPFIF